MMRSRVPELDRVKPDTPLRLDFAAAIVFPDGSMTACGLRKEAGRGRLAHVLMRAAGAKVEVAYWIDEALEQLERWQFLRGGRNDPSPFIVQQPDSSRAVKAVGATCGEVARGLGDDVGGVR